MSKRPPPQEVNWPSDAVFTVGHSTLPIEEFIALLAVYGIECVADVRKVPRSRHNPQFNSENLSKSLRARKIDYVPLPALGGLRHPRKDSPNTGWRNESFRGYADYMQTDAFAHALDNLINMSRAQRIAIMCAEAVPWRCHRSLVADALIARNIPAIEILSPAAYQDHQLTPFAHVQGNSITYPPEQAELF